MIAPTVLTDFTVTRPLIPGGEWFTGAGLGVFVTWDHASQQGIEISWPIVGHSIVRHSEEPEDVVTPDQYHASASTFNPTEFDSDEIALLIARSGATYAVFTTRHHAGYSMFHTTHSDFGIQNSEFGRDITAELVASLRRHGVRVGFYFSLSDWHSEHYPAFRLEDRPYPKEHWPEAYWPENADTAIVHDRHRRPSADDWEKHMRSVRGQLTELLTNYGSIDLLWFDGEWERSMEEWDTPGLRRLVKDLQPDVVINERLLGAGDYITPEQGFPSPPPAEPWEICMTIGEMWAWRPGDTNNKSVFELLSTIIEAASLGGNLLLNIGPTGTGALNPAQVERMDGIGAWMKDHRESVIGVAPTQEIQFYGPTTVRGDRLYLHLLMRPLGDIIVRNVPVRRVTGVTILGTGQPLEFAGRIEIHVQRHGDKEATGELRVRGYEPTDALIDVIAIDFA